jgi:glycosyltransferase involved in cell wall biosynthesis
MIGKGPQEEMVRQLAERCEWVTYVGPKNDVEKVPYWALSKVFLMPGLVGLAVLDSFALGVPMVTTAFPYHSPEIDYLRDGENGVMVADWQSARAYANAVISLMGDEARRQRMIAAGREAAGFYTVENMAKNFADGIASALAAPKRG